MTTTATTRAPSRPAQAPAALPRLTYRYDLDGLRGFAIALVVVFHVFVGKVSGGVDVFLLLSGYFFMGAQLRYGVRPNPSLNPWWPLWRTARRLLPALSVVLAATYAGIQAFAPEIMGGGLARQFTASALYYQNVELARQNLEYAAAGAETSPLQHLWSMSVQGQFYLFAIASGLLVAYISTRHHVGLKKMRNSAAIILAVITLASFIYASRFGFVGTPANYYSFPARLWELSLGALLAMLPASVRVPAPLQAPAAGLGILMITLTGFVIPTSLAFPGPAALIPLTGAALVVLSGPDHAVAGLLSSAPMTWLGKVAYSLYLWHWPLLILVTIESGDETPSLVLGSVVIAMSLALAHMTYTLVEDPLRQRGKRPTKLDKPVGRALESLKTFAGLGRALGGAVVAALLVGVLSIQPSFIRQVQEANFALDTALYPGALASAGMQVPDAEPKPDPRYIAEMFPPTVLDDCLIYMDYPADEMPHTECVYGDKKSDVTVVLFGGSHAEPWIIPLDKLGREHGFRVIPFLRQECPLVLDDLDTVSEVCADWSQLAFQQILNLEPDLAVSTSTRPAGRAGQGGVGPDIVPAAYATVWDTLRLNGIPFLGLRDNPWVFDSEGEHMDPNECIVAGHGWEECSTLRATVYGDSDPAAAVLRPENKQWSVDTADWFCGPELCPPVVGNVYVYRDQNHISNAFAASTTALLWEKLKEIFTAVGTPFKEGKTTPSPVPAPPSANPPEPETPAHDAPELEAPEEEAVPWDTIPPV